MGVWPTLPYENGVRVLHVPASDQSLGMKGPVSLSGFCGSDDRLFLAG
jgi:hypothetical protein